MTTNEADGRFTPTSAEKPKQVTASRFANFVHLTRSAVARFGQRRTGLGFPCPRDLALARALWPAWRARKVDNIEAVLFSGNPGPPRRAEWGA